ncbi:MAG: LamG domain-containing protein [Candidatus Aenigmarchaeota archaeon]|nr:LamG domain-containing protein [Candidatus Aenigmarchaeota archaeon]
MMKAISPLLAGILLVGITAISATMVSGWVSSTFSESQRSADNRSASVIECSTAGISIDNVHISKGSGGTASLAIRNSGDVDGLRITSAQIFDRLGNNFTANNSLTLNRGEIGRLEFKFPVLASTMTDSSPYGNNGTCISMGSACAFTLSGKSGSAMTFDGANDNINVTNSNSLNFGASTDFTLSAWIKRDSRTGQSENIVLFKGDGAGNTKGYWVSVRGSLNQVRFAISNDTGGFAANNIQFDSNTNITLGEWHHVTVTADRDGNATIYIDGIRESTRNISTVGNIDVSSKNLVIGALDPGNWRFDGVIDDMKIWNRALSETEINQSMNGLEMNQAGLVMWQKFDEAKGILSCPGDFEEARVTTQCADAVDTYRQAPAC